MNTARLKKALGNFHRLPEIADCMRKSPEWSTIIPAYVGFERWDYPRRIKLSRHTAVVLYSFEDLTSFWSVWFGDEYRVRRSDRVIVDAGANIGAFTLLAAERSEASIFSVEPFPENVQRLLVNLSLNGLPAARVKIFERAVTKAPGQVRMSIDPEIPSHSKTVRDDLSPEESVLVDSITINQLVEEVGGSIDLLKLDVEGSEYPFLEGGSREAMRAVDRFGIEYHARDGFQQLRDIILPHGFRVSRHRVACIDRGIAEFTRI